MELKQRKFLTEFIELYKSLPELWKIKSPYYRDRFVKNKAYNVLVQKYKEIDPDADKAMVIKKLKILRTVYLRELKKAKTRVRIGSNEPYVPSLWYFNHLHFIKNQQMDESKEEEEDEQVTRTSFANDEMHFEEETKCSTSFKHNRIKSKDDHAQIPSNTSRQKHNLIKSMDDYTQTPANSSSHNHNVIKSMDDYTQTPANTNRYNHNVIQSMDEYAQTLANAWAFEFRQAEMEQQIYAKKAIDDILFAARLGKLSTKSHQKFKNMDKYSCKSSIFSPYYKSQKIESPRKYYNIKKSQSNVTSSTTQKYFKSESPTYSLSDVNTEFLDEIIEEQETHPVIEVYMDEENTSMSMEDNADVSRMPLKKNSFNNKPHTKKRRSR